MVAAGPLEPWRSTMIRRCLTLICLALLLPLSLASCQKEKSTQAEVIAPKSETLTIITPHSQQIRDAFEVGFSNWYRENRGGYVTIDWIVRGTPQCVQYIEDIFNGSAGPAVAKTPDLMFGGGITDHEELARKDRSARVDLSEAMTDIPAEVRGLPTRHPDMRWFATGLSSFGIVYNDDMCRQRGIDPPTTWADLGDPRFRGWLAIADPSLSGSHRQAMMLVLESEGWNEGWGTLLRALANTRALALGSNDVLRQIESGILLAGFAVNFDGLALAHATDGKIRYINPPNATAVSPDVSSVLRCASNARLASDFLRYCLSTDGQLAWGAKSEEHNAYGPTLYHYPIDPKIYTEFAGKLAVAENPYEVDFGISADRVERGQQYVPALIPLVDAACGENHVLLQQAWEAVVDAGMPQDALAELTKAPMDEAEAIEAGKKLESAGPEEAARTREEWSTMFRDRYEHVLEMVNGQKAPSSL